MKHESINTFIAVIGLGLAAFSTFMQLKPQSDALDIIATTSNAKNKGFYLKEGNLPTELFEESRSLAGSYDVTLEITNNLNRTVSIKAIEIKFIINEGNAIYYNDMIYSEFDRNILNTPIPYEAYSVKRLKIFLNIPIIYDDRFRKCFHPTRFISEYDKYFDSIKHCYYSKNTDMMDNKVNSRTLDGGGVIFTHENKNSLRYEIIVTTGDNTKIRKEFNIHG
ncbi:hypothetical protein CS369_21000 [Candidatus Symbiopectobacterium sp. 'North America']|uniref:hypothetical protein n=1 Tax=Candidatus Symbiopectobacterium sp. 'North America' TaxID=2794574 RepID=UPI001B3549C6|nr:hypothetical protein [Candidatus Symbiopectobacterium sp. 'North America']MBG6246577.1 hypothetical protein [Candidatus Symbiopectobacterium sp. 'North America']